jgi:hypothetical protein
VRRHRTILIAVDGEIPSVVVKSVVQSAARAGFPEIGFLVHKIQ